MIHNNSQILMASGISKRIDRIRVGERIISDMGVRIPVVGLCFKIKKGYIIVITMAGEREVWCTPDQRFFSSYGLKRADEIKVGMTLESPIGCSDIIEVRWIPYNGVLRSLILPECEDERNRLMYTNGAAIEAFSK